MALGWRPQFSLEQGLQDAYDWFVAHYNKKTLT
jgi:nucleoside-diphosphate-sugar epimerase